MEKLLYLVRTLFKKSRDFFNFQVNKYGVPKVTLILITAPFLLFIQWSLAFVGLYKFVTVVPWSEIVQVIFFTKDHQLNGVGTASALSVVLLIINIWDGRRKTRMDLRSKSRIDWMKIVRPLLADYTTHISKYLFLYDKYFFENDLNNVKQLSKELTEIMEKIRTEYYQLILYIPNNYSNILLIRNIELLFGELNNIPNYYDSCAKSLTDKDFNETDDQKITAEYVDNLILKTITDGRKYFKKEWERAKKGK